MGTYKVILLLSDELNGLLYRINESSREKKSILTTVRRQSSNKLRYFEAENKLQNFKIKCK